MNKKRGLIDFDNIYRSYYGFISMNVFYIYLGGGSGSLSVGEFGILSTVAYPPPQQEPSNGERSLAL